MSIIADPALARSGENKIGWVRSNMPCLARIEKDFERDRPFAGKKIAMSIHLEAKTANLAIALRAGGAQVYVTGCNPLSTQDDVAAALAGRGFEVFAFRGASEEEYNAHLKMALSCKPDVILDDGGDLTNLLHGSCAALAENLIGGTEETTTGIHRLRARAAAGALRFPAIDVNDADCKHLFDNRYGTGQSVWDAVMHTTNLLITGKNVVVAGYGWCGRGVAMRARALGAMVYVTEIDPVKAIEAAMDGYHVVTMDEAAPLGDFFVTVTGCNSVITARHFEKMRDGALLCNAGHFDVEVDKTALSAMAENVSVRRENIKGYRLRDGRVLNLLAEGRLVNLAAGNGHPAEIMDMSFSLQALCLRYLIESGAGLAPAVYDVPREIDRWVASLKLSSMGLGLDSLSPEQEAYLKGY